MQRTSMPLLVPDKKAPPPREGGTWLLRRKIKARLGFLNLSGLWEMMGREVINQLFVIIKYL